MIHPPGGFGLRVVPTASVDPSEIVVHDETVDEPAYAFALSRLPGEDLRNTPIGVFRKVARNSYDTSSASSWTTAKAKLAGDPEARADRPAGRRRHLDDPVASAILEFGATVPARYAPPRSGEIRRRSRQSPQMANVMPRPAWMFTNSVWPSGENVEPANSSLNLAVAGAS